MCGPSKSSEKCPKWLFFKPSFFRFEKSPKSLIFRTFWHISFFGKKTPRHLVAGVARFLILAAGRGLGPCSGCPSCPLLRSPSGRGFFVFALTLGALFRRLSRRLDFGERTPAGCIDAGHSGLASQNSLPVHREALRWLCPPFLYRG